MTGWLRPKAAAHITFLNALLKPQALTLSQRSTVSSRLAPYYTFLFKNAPTLINISYDQNWTYSVFGQEYTESLPPINFPNNASGAYIPYYLSQNTSQTESPRRFPCSFPFQMPEKPWKAGLPRGNVSPSWTASWLTSSAVLWDSFIPREKQENGLVSRWNASKAWNPSLSF